MENNEVVQLYLDDIIPNRFQPREIFNDQALKELAISIREHGVIQPILVRKFGEKYEIIAGERRYKASTMAGLTKIPAIIKNLDDKESSKVALIENLQRRDLTPIEEARTYQKILDLDEMTQEELAKTMGKSQSAVSNKLRLLSLPDEIQEALLKEEISERHARSLLNVEDKNVQVDLLKEIVNNKMTVRELDVKIKKLSGEDNESNSGNSSDTATGGNSVFIQEIKEEKNENNTVEVNQTENLFNVTEEKSNDSLNNDIENRKVEKEAFDSLFGNSEKVDNMNSNFMEFNFDDVNTTNTNSVNTNESDSLVNNSENSNFIEINFGDAPTNVNTDNDVNNIGSLFNDPTTVDVNKIREEASDINPVLPEKESIDINSLLNPEGFNKNEEVGFIKSFDDVEEITNEKSVINGSGLLSEMPVIAPVDNEKNKSAFSSLFNEFKADSINENVSDSLFGTTQNAVNNESVIAVNNVSVAVNDVKNFIKGYQEKGYTVSVEELDLDREIQLIVKFNKN